MAKTKDPTKTEIKLTVAATILAFNLHQLLQSYESLAAKNDIVVNPIMQESIANAIAQFAVSIDKKPDLQVISQDIIQRICQFKQQHEQLDT
jgi:hypothetical protein